MHAETDTSNDARQAMQRIVKVRRDYNVWVANETLEDYALRFTPRAFRKWSELWVANTAFGAASFLVLEAVGATILVNYGFANTLWAVLAMGVIIFLTGLPISYYAARYGVDMDLLTRGAGFGYIGSTITSLIYASFTFILFALEAAIMAYALELYFSVPPYLGYLISSLIVIPLVTHGITLISRLQMLTQPVWLVMLVLPYAFVIYKNPHVLADLQGYAGRFGHGDHFQLFLFGSAVTVGLALITQIGEQVDFLRFMPEKTAKNRGKWWAAVLVAGPGWILLGIPKMLGGALLAFLAIKAGTSLDKAIDPNQMYLVGFKAVFSNGTLALAVTALFVIISQLKINITNAYAGSLAWSNFFSRVTHSHPGRVVWVVFNVLIAFLLMEMNVFQALEQVLGLYSNVAISWVVAVVADLMINKPLGLSPKGIEFKRAYLYDINPVGVGSMICASVLSIMAFAGAFGHEAQAFSAFIAMIVAFVTSPLIAWWTRGRYYLVRKPDFSEDCHKTRKCSICEKEYEGEDMAMCPAYRGPICSLCCSLDVRCHDLCKPSAHIGAQWDAMLQRLLPRALSRYLKAGLGHYLLLMSVMLVFLAALLGLVYYHELIAIGPSTTATLPQLRLAFLEVFAGLVLASGIAAWWLVLTGQSRRVAQEESNLQTNLLVREIDAHRQTDVKLQTAKQVAERANEAKTRYVTGISHELRTPLNSILGYAQILDVDAALPPHRRQAIRVIRRSGEHLLSLIEGVLDMARIESGKLALDVTELHFPEFLQQIARMFELQARNKGIDFRYEPTGEIPVVVRADKRRLGQILINILGNAVKFTERGGVVFRVSYAREMAAFEIEDSGPGIAAEDVERIFEPFERGAASGAAGGTGLGLTISKMLTDLMGGELNVKSRPGSGSQIHIRLFLPHVHAPRPADERMDARRVGYAGERKRILLVENERNDRELLVNVLEPLGFELAQAASGDECLRLCPEFRPHLILMDLAMPGIDGWETIRRIRRDQLSDAHIAVVSANAFDQGLENDAGITPADFVVKPVSVAEFLDRVGNWLHLTWRVADAAEAAPDESAAPARPFVYPPQAQVEALSALVNMGYVRGILGKLEEMEKTDARHTEFVRVMRELAQRFQLDAMAVILQQAGIDEAVHSG